MIKISSPMFTSAKEVHVYYYACLLCILNSIYCKLLCSFDLPARAISHHSIAQCVKHCDRVSFSYHLQKKNNSNCDKEALSKILISDSGNIRCYNTIVANLYLNNTES